MSGKYNITIEQGATWSQSFQYKDSSGVAIPLTGYTARMQCRATKESASTVINLTTENGGITITPATGTVVCTLSATATAALTAGELGLYDLEIVSTGGVVTRLIEGRITVSREITR